MNISDKSMAAILLCTYIGLNKNVEVKPYTPGEWERFENDLKDNNLQIETVVTDPTILNMCGYKEEEIERIQLLKNRGVNVALELERYESKGIKVITVFDKEYPSLLRRKLLLKAPAVLLYAGNLELANKVGIGIVGSRNVNEEIIEFGKALIEKAVSEKMIIYTGGAKGVDSIAEQAALAYGGAVVEFLADSLEDKIKNPEVIKAILEGRLLLFTDTKADIGFSVAKAMNRNKYIYNSSYGTFVVSSDYNVGGTWAGAIEALRREYCKVFIWNNPKYLGNMKLISEKKGIPYELSEKYIREILDEEKHVVSEVLNSEEFVQISLLDIMGGLKNE